jgi:hypothetical protein
MTTETIPKFRLTVGTWLALISMMAMAVGTYTLAQSQLVEHDKRITRLEVRDEQTRLEFALMRELLVRIDERTVEIKRKQDLNGK